MQVVLMGDSAGGGLALLLAQHLAAEGGARPPDSLVLLSPWLDVSVTMTEQEHKQLARLDPFLTGKAM